MSFIKSAPVFLILFFSGLASFAQLSGIETINTDDLKRHLSFISSDSLQGRSFGTPIPGLDIAADYIKSNAKSIGLKSADDDFFQTVPIITSQSDIENSYLEILDTNGKVILKTDSVIGLPSGNDIDILNAEIVFAGFGYKDEKTGYDDLKEFNLTGKVVLFSIGSPKEFQNNDLPVWNNRLESAKIKRAKEAGAVGAIVVNSPMDKENSVYNRINRYRKRSNYSLKTPDTDRKNDSFVFITASQADAILGSPGKLSKLLSKISREKQAKSFYLESKRANIKIKSKIKHFEAKNIIGIVEGSDRILKNECVVIMAHYDHLGIDKNGDIFNGADDNGSGTVTLLEVAEAFMSLPEKPKRSIVFLWVTAEEVGMLGSQYYSENPVFPIEKTVACINIDMDGRVFEQRDTVWQNSAKKVKDFDGLYTLTNDFWPGLKEINSTACKTLGLIPDYSLPSNFLRSSDHFSFHNKGVPILNFATGYHADYHKVTDEISRINFDKMKRVADLCFLVGLEIANQVKIEITGN